MKIETWFPTSILTGCLDIDPKCQKLCLDKIFSIRKNNQNNDVGWRCDTFSTMNLFDMQNDQDFKSIFDLTFPLIDTFAKYYGVKNPKISCNGAWANIAPPGEYQEYHIHPNSHLSFVLYLKTAKNCGNIVFRNPESFNNMFEFRTEPTFSSYQTCFYEPQDFYFVCFKSNLWHMVEKNKSDKDRVSLAFNFTVI